MGTKQVNKVIHAMLNGKCMTLGNSSTDGISLYLHGNRIAEALPECDGTISYSFSLAGWNTATTRRHINAFLDAVGRSSWRVRTVKCAPMVNGRVISDREWITV